LEQPKKSADSTIEGNGYKKDWLARNKKMVEIKTLSMYDINVVVVNYKTKDDVDRCLASLFSDFKGDNLLVRVVVVDNDSRDGIAAWLKEKYPSVNCLVQSKNFGFSRSQNVGLKSAAAKYHLALNPDTLFYYGQHVLRQLFDFMEANPRVGIAGPKIVYPDGSLQYSCYRFPTLWQPLFSRTKFGERGLGKDKSDRLLMKDFDHDYTTPVDWVMGSAMFVRSEATEEVGLFDDRFWMYYEDSDWCRRMWEAGWAVYYVHDITIQHTHGRGSAKVPGIFLAILKNKLARVHIMSWFKYMWKWRGNYKYYG